MILHIKSVFNSLIKNRKKGLRNVNWKRSESRARPNHKWKCGNHD